jgi:hypothetical protein
MGDATLGLERRLNILDTRDALVIGGKAPWTIAVDGDTVVGRVVSSCCHGPRYGWPQFIAALAKSDLWIRRNSCP